MKMETREPSGVKLPVYTTDRLYIMMPELFPCEEFECVHDSMACGMALICPEGTKIQGNYSGICVPQCIDCNKNNTCKQQRSRKTKYQPLEFNPSKREFGHENEIVKSNPIIKNQGAMEI